jgi:hypothetical protein
MKKTIGFRPDLSFIPHAARNLGRAHAKAPTWGCPKFLAARGITATEREAYCSVQTSASASCLFNMLIINYLVEGEIQHLLTPANIGVGKMDTMGYLALNLDHIIAISRRS